jgi:hypothetical protein
VVALHGALLEELVRDRALGEDHADLADEGRSKGADELHVWAFRWCAAATRHADVMPAKRRSIAAGVIEFALSEDAFSLTALSPLDGRYAAKTRPLQEHFSEYALMRERVAVEVAWLLALGEEPSFDALAGPFSAATPRGARGARPRAFSIEDAERIRRSRRRPTTT